MDVDLPQRPALSGASTPITLLAKLKRSVITVTT